MAGSSDPADALPALPLLGARPSFRSKRVCLSVADWQAFGDALAEAYPPGQYVRHSYPGEDKTAVRPEDMVANHLCGFNDSDDGPPWRVILCLDPRWKLEFVRDDRVGIRWKHPTGYPHVTFDPGWQRRNLKPGSPEQIHKGEIAVSCAKDVKAHLAFARRFFQLFRNFATNTNQIGVRHPSYEVLWSIEKGSDTWLGHDAIRWAREDKRRLLYYEDRGETGWGYRPNDEGIVKPAARDPLQ